MSRHNRRGVATGAVTALNRPSAKVRTEEGKTWYKFGQPKNAATPDAPTNTEVWIYDEIGMWGVSAGDFARDLAQVDTDAITVRLNSPGGEVYDGIAILNALIGHPAHVTVKVDGLAASIASVIAMAGDKVVMGAHSEMMIHDASTVAFGNAADVREVADMLDRVSDNIAQVYAERAGGKASDWRGLMLAETWMSAPEAVTAGLADEVATTPKERSGDDPDEDDGDTKKQGDDPDEEEEATARYSRNALSTFTYSGRAVAPAPALAAIQSQEVDEPTVEEPEPTVEVLDPEFPAWPDTLASAFTDAMTLVISPTDGIDAGVFRAAVALVTDAPVVVPPARAPAAPVVVEAPNQAFPIDHPDEPDADRGTPDLFRTAMQMAVFDAPDVVTAPPSKPEVVDDFAVIDPAEFYNSLREAIIK